MATGQRIIISLNDSMTAIHVTPTKPIAVKRPAGPATLRPNPVPFHTVMPMMPLIAREKICHAGSNGLVHKSANEGDMHKAQGRNGART